MNYTGPKFKLCRREGVNIYGLPKYDVKKNRKTPGQHGATMPRLTEYWKLLRNKQLLKRIYNISEKTLKNLVTKTAPKYSKNKWIDFDVALVQFLERRLDNVVLKAGFAKTIFQARQMVSHWNFQLNWKNHNVASTFVEKWDKISLRSKLKESSLYWDISNNNQKNPLWMTIDKKDFVINVVDLPDSKAVELPVDVLKVIEYYAR